MKMKIPKKVFNIVEYIVEITKEKYKMLAPKKMLQKLPTAVIKQGGYYIYEFWE